MKNTDRRKFLRTLSIMLLAVGSPVILAEPPHGKYKKNKGGKGKSGNGSGYLVSAGITAAVARDLYRGAGGHGGAYKSLPPGIRKNLARGKPIPPGIAKTRLPGGFVGALPAYSGYEWIGAGVDLLLVQTASGLIADVLFDVLL